MTLRVACYIHPHRIGLTATGVGKHIGNMTAELMTRPGVELSLLAPRKDWDMFAEQVPDSPLRNCRVDQIGMKRAVLEKLWSIAALPAAEWWTGPVDWVYCPMEAYVPTRGARLAVTIHCMNWFERFLPWYADSRWERNRWRVKLWRLLHHTDALLPVVSEYLKGRMVELFGIRPERLPVVGNGVEHAYFALGDAGPAPGTHPPFLLVVGGLTYRKGGDRILATAAYLRDRQSDLGVRVVGLCEPTFEARARELANVELLGYRGITTGLPELMRGATAVYFPSRYESFGIPAAEAMAAGVPVIVTPEAALPEVVGNAGLIVPPDDPAAVSETATKLLADTYFRRSIIENGRRRARDHTWAVCGDRLMASLGSA